ncbi:MAG: hypothetical protein ACTHKG_04020 [Nocardioides sp.]
MTTAPETLLAFDREVVWSQSRGILRRVSGPSFTVPEGETLVWFDPLDGVPQVISQVPAGRLSTFATAVEWPPGFPEPLSGAALVVGDPDTVVAWDTASLDDRSRVFSTDHGMACVVTSRHVPQVAEDLRDMSRVRTALAAVGASMVHPLEVDGEVVGVAFDCGMGASSNPVHVGRDASGQVVALLADLDLLTRGELA